MTGVFFFLRSNVAKNGKPAPEAAKPAAEAKTEPEAKPAAAAPAAAETKAAAADTKPETADTKAAAPEAGAGAKEEKPKKGGKLKKVLVGIAVILILLIACFFLIVGFMKSSDSAMEGSFSKGDTILYLRVDKEPQINDVVVFENQAGKLSARRMIADGGDTVYYNPMENKIVVNDQPIENIPDSVDWWGIDLDFDFPITVQEDEIFVLSGNREDPSSEGLVKKDKVKGKAFWYL